MSANTPPTAAHTRTPEPGVEPDGIDAAALALWGLVSVVAVICVMLAAAAVFFNEQNKIDQEFVVAPKYPDAERIFTDQQGLLADYKAPDAEGQPYRIPIDLAKQRVLDQFSPSN